MFRIGPVEIEFANLEQWPVVLPVMLLIAALTAVLYATERKVVKGRVGLVLTGLRVALMAVLAAALLDLRIRQVTDENESLRRRVAVAVDTSWSMDLPDPSLDDAARLRIADAAGLLPAGMRSAKPEVLPALAGIASVGIGELETHLAALADSLREIAKLEGPHPRAVAAAAQAKFLTAALERLDKRIGEALEPAAAAKLPEAVRAGLAEVRGSAVKKLTEAVKSASRLPLDESVMMSRQAAGDLGSLGAEIRSYLDSAGLPGLRAEAAALKAKLSKLADQADAETLRVGGTGLADILAKVGRTPRRELVRLALARGADKGEGLLDRLKDRYAMRVLLFDRVAAELSPEDAFKRLAEEPTAPLNAEKLAKFLKARADAATSTEAYNPAFTDYDPVLRTAAGKAPPVTVAGLVLVSDGISNPPPGRRPASSSASASSDGTGGGATGGLRTLAGRLGLPVVAVAAGAPDNDTGRSRAPRDVRIAGLEEPRSVFKDSEAEVGVNWAAVNVPRGTPLTFRLTSDGKPVPGGEKIVEASADSGRVSFRLDTAAKGVRNYKVEVLPVEGEMIETNNARSFSVTVADSKLRILVIDEEARWEWRYIKDALERDRDRNVVESVILKPAELEGVPGQKDATGNVKAWGRFPDTAEELNKYDVVVLGDLDPRGRFFRDDQTVENLRAYVQQRGGSLVAAPGRKYFAGRRFLPENRRRTFEELLPVDLPDPADPKSDPDNGPTARETFKLLPTEEGERSVITRLAGQGEDNAEVWNSFQPQQWRCPVNEAKPGASVAVTIRPRGGGGEAAPEAAGGRRDYEKANPIICYHRSGLGRVMAVTVSSTWRMRFRVGDKYHARLWGQIARWAAPGGFPAGNEYVQMRADKAAYQAGETIRVEVRINDKDGKPLRKIEPELVAYVGDPASGGQVAERVRLQYVEDSAGLWRAEFRGLRGGRYTFLPTMGKGDAASIADASFALPETGLSVEVRGGTDIADTGLPPEVQAELSWSGRDSATDVLEGMAAASGGAALDLSALEEIPHLLAALEKPIDHLRRNAEETGPRWGLWLLLGLFTLIVSVEWIVRKRVGLI